MTWRGAAGGPRDAVSSGNRATPEMEAACHGEVCMGLWFCANSSQPQAACAPLWLPSQPQAAQPFLIPWGL